MVIKMAKIKELFSKHREIIMYLFFGVMTTLVGWIMYFVMFWTWKSVFEIRPEDTKSLIYITGYTVAQVLQWIAAVMFAFFTNRRWVFTDAEKNVKLLQQMMKFCGGRLVTFFIDYIVTYFGAMLLSLLFPAIVAYEIFGKTLNFADLIAKFIAAVIVIISNYIFSKLFVFKKSTDTESK